VKTLALFIFALPVAAFAWFAWRRAYELARDDAKRTAALQLADRDRNFAVALSTVLNLAGSLPANAPWTRPEHGDRHVYVMGGRP